MHAERLPVVHDDCGERCAAGAIKVGKLRGVCRLLLPREAKAAFL